MSADSDLTVVAREHQAYPGLDSLRAVAALMVLGTHVAFWSGFYNNGLLGAMSSRLDVGVAVFFVLSGFLLGRPFLAAMADGRAAPRAGRYLWKRALRIWPLYAIISVLALAVLSDNRETGVGTWIRTLTLTQIYPGGELVAGLTHMWSLCVEVAFYLALPLLMWILRAVACRGGWDIRRILLGLGALAVVGWTWLLFVAPHVAGASLWPPAFLAWFAAGLALAAITVEQRRDGGRRFPVVTDLAALPGVSWTIALALFAISATPLGGPILLLQPTAAEALTKNVLYALIAALILAPSILGARSSYADVLATRPLRHLGLISYGVFCLHLVVIHAVADWRDLPLYQGHGWELLAFTLVISIVLAEIAYAVVERPAMKLRSLGDRRPPAEPPTPAATPNAPNTNH